LLLTDTFIKKIQTVTSTAGDKYTDGQGLYLHVKTAGKYWRMNYRFGGKQKTLALGVYPAVSLASARKLRDAARELLAQGKDPSVAKREGKRAELNSASATFEAVAEEWIKVVSKTRKETTQLKTKKLLGKNVSPHLGKIPITTISAKDVLEVLRKVEARGSIETAHRVKQIIGQVFRYAIAAGKVEHDVTSGLRGALSAIPKKHLAAITDPKQVGALLRSIYDYEGHPSTVAALKFAPLVFVRPGELRAAEWAEIDFSAAQWRIPGSKMKMKTDHIVPLSRQALEILRGIQPMSGGGKYIFPSLRSANAPLSDNTLNAALRGMGYSKEAHTAHGFRAMARTILDEVLGERVDLIEHQLAHAVKDPNGRAYNRTAHLPARIKMMQRWGDYLDRLRLS